jgi:diguanylate cyclase (GGDEF)-like protein/PAS domain S-box-containing protein
MSERRSFGVRSEPLLLGGGFFATAASTVLLTRFDNGVAFIWVSTALLLAWLIHTPRSKWRGGLAACCVASLLVTTFVGYGAYAAPFFIPANVGEALIAYRLLRRVIPHANYFGSLNGVAAFIAVSCIAPMISGVIASAIIYIANGHSVVSSYLSWVTGHAIGTVALTPIFSLMIGSDTQPWNADHRRGPVETISILAMVTLTVGLVFSQSAMPLLFLPMLPMMVATIRLGRFGAASSTAILAVLGGALTLKGLGPVHLLHASDGERVQFFQFYVGTAVLLLLPVAALLKQHQHLLVSLSASEARHDLIARHVSDAILNLAVDGTILYASPAFRQLGGYDPEELIGRNARDLVSQDDAERMVAAHREALAQPHRTISAEYRAATSTGELLWFENRTRAVMGDGDVPVGVVSAIRDITDRKDMEARLMEAANTDPLTGLHNRRAFMTMLEHQWSRVREGNGRCGLVLFDIDHFKRVNDRYGHQTGDMVLKTFAEIARGMLRETDMLARIGGEEFALLLWNSDEIAASRIAERIREAIARALLRSDQNASFSITISAGVADLATLESPRDAFRRVDEALYRAKADGRNCWRSVA